jgi:hypothetical protein
MTEVRPDLEPDGLEAEVRPEPKQQSSLLRNGQPEDGSVPPEAEDEGELASLSGHSIDVSSDDEITADIDVRAVT